MKKSLTSFFLLMFCCELVCLICLHSTAKAEQKAATYNNTKSAFMNAACDQSGVLSIEIEFKAATGVTSNASIKTYIEKRGFLGLFWTRVDIPPVNDEWIDTTTASFLSTTHQHTLTSHGKYRVTSELTVSGSGGPTDEIEATKIVDY